MRKIFFIFFMSIVLGSVLYSQIVEQYGTIRGRVVDAKAGNPLPNVNVFLANTTMGCATDANGWYLITQIPNGRYELVASRVGYEVESVPLHIQKLESTFQNLKLKPTIIEGEKVTVTGKKLKKQTIFYCC